MRRADQLASGILPTVACICVCDREASIMRRPWSLEAVVNGEKSGGRKEEVIVVLHATNIIIIIIYCLEY